MKLFITFHIIKINNMKLIKMLLSSFIIQFYFKVVFVFIAHYLNKIFTMNLSVQFIIIVSYDDLITNKVL